jgi:NAD(P)-dependent dehydrogenase (short-subunit alcohol dehydrogenase family)
MRGKTVVITGASSGIGLETARALAAKGATITMVVRSQERGDAAIASIRSGVPDAQIDLVRADLYSLAEVRTAAAELRAKHPRIDVLVNNAGLIHRARELTVDGFEKTFALNHLAAFLLTHELRDVLAGRVVTVSSAGHRYARFEWDDLQTMRTWKGEIGVYGASKLCNIWFAREAARRFATTGVTSNALHPGPVATSFGQSGSWLFKYGTRIVRPFLLTAAEGARTSVHLASSPEVAGVTGEYFAKCQIKQPSRRAQDDASARRLWELSERLCGVSWS